MAPVQIAQPESDGKWVIKNTFLDFDFALEPQPLRPAATHDGCFSERAPQAEREGEAEDGDASTASGAASLAEVVSAGDAEEQRDAGATPGPGGLEAPRACGGGTHPTPATAGNTQLELDGKKMMIKNTFLYFALEPQPLRFMATHDGCFGGGAQQAEKESEAKDRDASTASGMASLAEVVSAGDAEEQRDAGALPGPQSLETPSACGGGTPPAPAIAPPTAAACSAQSESDGKWVIKNTFLDFDFALEPQPLRPAATHDGCFSEGAHGEAEEQRDAGATPGHGSLEAPRACGGGTHPAPAIALPMVAAGSAQPDQGHGLALGPQSLEEVQDEEEDEAEEGECCSSATPPAPAATLPRPEPQHAEGMPEPMITDYDSESLVRQLGDVGNTSFDQFPIGFWWDDSFPCELMIKNVPQIIGYQSATLARRLHINNLLECVWFVYVPLNIKTEEPHGYAFVSCTSPAAAQWLCTCIRRGLDLGGEAANGKKPDVAAYDGDRGLWERYADPSSKLHGMHDRFKPLVVGEDGGLYALRPEPVRRWGTRSAGWAPSS